MKKKDFTTKSENVSRKIKGKREYLNDKLTRDLIKKLEASFVSIVEVPKIKVGKRQTFETLINEEALLLAKYLRGEKDCWDPRIPTAIDRNHLC